MAYKTPGVYIKEVSIFPPSVAEVETAIPAFIGYTEKAEKKGETLTNKPTKIKSLLDFHTLFGDEYEIEIVEIKVDENNSFAVSSVDPDKRFYLYEALRQFFDNGGGDCYIVSVGPFTSKVELGNSADPSNEPGLSVGLKMLEKYNEPTIILFPDAPLLDESVFYTLQQRALAQCAKLQDRVSVLDLYEMKDRDLDETVDEFRNSIGINNLKYGAAYTPWLYTTYKKTIDLSIFESHVKNSNGSDQSLEGLTSDSDLNALVTSAKASKQDQATLDGMVSGLLSGGAQTIKDRFAFLRNAVMAADDASAAAELTALIGYVQKVAAGLPGLQTSFKGKNLKLDLDAYASDTLKQSINALVALEKNNDVRALTGVINPDLVNPSYQNYDATGWIDEYDLITSPPRVIVSEILGSTTDYGDLSASPSLAKTTAVNIVVGRDAADPKASAKGLDDIFAGIHGFIQELIAAAQTHADFSQNILYEKHSIVGNIVEHIKRDFSQVPPSGSVAGIYAFVDNARGVWKVPANVSVNGVRGPTEQIGADDQESLNIDVTGGKSINAIRTFTGRGTLVWGARTLAGNDNEWRYVPVRRFFNMVEESVKKSTAWAVFEPNTAQLWSKVKSMIDNYLIQKWREGALVGSTPDEAFFVRVGLGQTMTAQDILEGKLIIEIGMAAVRPTEFIILKFMHKLQES